MYIYIKHTVYSYTIQTNVSFSDFLNLFKLLSAPNQIQAMH